MEYFLNERDLKLQLLAGMSIDIDNVCTITPPNLKQIIKIGESNFNKYISNLLVDKSQIEHFKDKDVTNLEAILIMCMYDEEFKNTFLSGLYLFLNEEVSIHNGGFLFFTSDDVDSGRKISSDVYNTIQYVLTKANHIEKKTEEDYNPANERAKKFIEKLKLNKKKAPKKKSNIDIHSILSGLAWKPNDCNIFNILDLTLYQLYDAYYRQENIDNYHYVLHGIYAGTIDNKKINMSDINWAKILKL